MPWAAPTDLVTSQSLLALLVGYLQADGATAAGPQVYQPGDWPTQRLQLPVIKLRILRERRASQGRGTPGYTTTTTIRVVGEVQAYAQVDNAGATAAEAACWNLKRQIEVAIINRLDLYMRISQIASIESGLVINSEGATHIASIVMDFALEFFEDADSFAPIEADQVDEMQLTATLYAPDAPVSATIPLKP